VSEEVFGHEGGRPVIEYQPARSKPLIDLNAMAGKPLDRANLHDFALLTKHAS
jgi:hypothetical protein